MATAAASPKLPKPSKRLIICCDGTWKTGDHDTKGDSSYQTNITRICHALADDADMPDGRKIPQIVYYQSGVGSSSRTAIERTIAGAVGYGVNENILSAYNFLVNNYSPGDELFFFGFSRGSFTCRSLAGMISKIGILKQEAAGEWFSGIWDRYQGNSAEDAEFRDWERKRHDLVHDVKIKVLGCWDTVGSLGIPENPVTKFFDLNREHAFHDTELSNKVEYAFHALALDEHRGTFSPTLWYIPPEAGNVPPERRTRLKQCWFPGVHTDVGRGYEDQVPGDIADITFAWMVDQCRSVLDFRDDKVPDMLQKGDHKKLLTVDEKEDWDKRADKAKTWGLADLHDSMTLVFKLGSSIDRTPGQYVFEARGSARGKTDKSDGGGSPSPSGFVTKSKVLTDSEPDKKPWLSRLWSTASGVFTGPPDDLSKLDQVWTSEVIHPSVRMRMMQDQYYDPPALRGFKPAYDANRGRWTWTKKWTDAHGVVREKRLHEDRMEGTVFSLSLVKPETLKLGEGAEEPIPPRKKKSWFSSE